LWASDMVEFRVKQAAILTAADAVYPAQVNPR